MAGYARDARVPDGAPAVGGPMGWWTGWGWCVVLSSVLKAGHLSR